MTQDRLALAQLVAAATYGQLAGFSLTAALVRSAPDVAVAERRLAAELIKAGL